MLISSLGFTSYVTYAWNAETYVFVSFVFVSHKSEANQLVVSAYNAIVGWI